ncbi:30S ribosomal protein S19 [Candidatus Pacearchaeota archaeon]|nr:30S ribosomal protein S19 [uncultured archaeon]MBS3099948.1 30S ribosomal protein S19 [Candidatus Pacearchaeota archaeon]
MAEEISMERKKEFIFRGKTLEELGKLDIREFAKLVPSRERRTMLRNTDVIEKFLSRCNKKNDRKKVIKTHNRNIIIVPAMIGMIVLIHNGKTFEKLVIAPEMLGHRIGEFSMTRKTVKHGAAGIGATRSSASRSVK